MLEPKPVQLAFRYARSEWERICKRPTPLPNELGRSIVQTVMACGYSRKVVDKLIEGFRKNCLLCGCSVNSHKCLISQGGCGNCVEHCVCVQDGPDAEQLEGICKPWRGK